MGADTVKLRRCQSTHINVGIINSAHTNMCFYTYRQGERRKDKRGSCPHCLRMRVPIVTGAYIYVCTFVQLSVDVCIYVHVHQCAYVQTCASLHLETGMQRQVCRHMHTHVLTGTCINTQHSSCTGQCPCFWPRLCKCTCGFICTCIAKCALMQSSKSM